jgi:hypothetical protein
MRLVDLLRIVGPLVGVCVGAVMGIRRNLVRHYESRGAFGAETAIAPPAPLRALTRWWRDRLLASGELRSLGDGREWLDQEIRARSLKTRRARALSIAGTLIALWLLTAWWAATRP